ncbi:hypothetical protein ABDJ41_00480 [Pedobacter sp. ASV1-7]|uniref:hypothetical protein n=1 Tax=Pedobacter sp. ASV1-7 TaxID=3145237 RepID=UPI0032E8DC4A
MKKGLFIVLLVSVFTQIAVGQTIKTGVLVIGNGSNAIGAGFQSAISGVKTLMLIQKSGLNVSISGKSMSTGLEAQFLKRMPVSKAITDNNGKILIDQVRANEVLKVWVDSLKNLTVIRSVKPSRIKRSGNNWNVLLADGRTIKAEVLVNADGTNLPDIEQKLWRPFNYNDNLYRMSLSAGYELGDSNANIIPLSNFQIPEQENLIMLDRKHESLAAGQAGGATAAYVVFFKTKTSLADLKIVQKELLNYKLAIVPFADIEFGDPNWTAIQYVGLSGFLKAGFANRQANFMPDQEVTTAEVKEPIKEFYYKAQIWFDDYKEEKMTIGSTISLVSMVGNKSPESTKELVKKKWEKQYHFKGNYDLNRPISRREFAVLIEEYLNPFTVSIDKTGRVIR